MQNFPTIQKTSSNDTMMWSGQMDNFSTLLSKQFNASLAENFGRRASYYSTMDFLEYLSEDTTVVADRVDGFLTILLDAEQKRLIGFRCKGFGYVFKNYIQKAMKLDDGDFNPIVFALEAIFTCIGDDFFPKEIIDQNDERRANAYKQSRALAKRDNVTLPQELRAA